MTRQNIVLIGMAGAGKSTVGVLLAKALFRNFIDTDLVIQSAEGRLLQDIVDEVGKEAFQKIEARHVLSISVPGAVIATGGSVVYSEEAMYHLGLTGIFLFLKVPFSELERRVMQTGARGLAISKGQTLEELYMERLPLYLKYANITVDCEGLSHDEVVTACVNALDEYDPK